jgi:hypothetical protein
MLHRKGLWPFVVDNIASSSRPWTLQDAGSFFLPGISVHEEGQSHIQAGENLFEEGHGLLTKAKSPIRQHPWTYNGAP